MSIKDSVLLASLLTNMQCEMVERHVRALNRITTNFKDGVVSSHTFYTTLYIVHTVSTNQLATVCVKIEIIY